MASRVWKDGTRRGIAYVEGQETARKVMEATGRGARTAPRRRGAAGNVEEAKLEGAMAVYSDRRGRPFAWQIPFDIGQWERVSAMIGAD